MMLLTSRYSLIIQIFAAWKIDKTSIKLYRIFFLHKSNKKTWVKTFCTFAGMTSLTLNSKLYNLIVSWNLIKTQQNFAQNSFSIKLRKISHKNRGEVLASGKACNFIKKRLQHRCFLVNIGKFLRTPILKNICERLLLLKHSQLPSPCFCSK